MLKWIAGYFGVGIVLAAPVFIEAVSQIESRSFIKSGLAVSTLLVLGWPITVPYMIYVALDEAKTTEEEKDNA